MKRETISLICAIGLLLSPINIQAETTETTTILNAVIAKNVISATSDFYFLDRISEEVMDKITFDKSDKVNYRLNLAKERLSELYYGSNMNIEQQKQLLKASNDNITEAIIILPEIVESDKPNRKDMLEITYNIVSSFHEITLKILEDKQLNLEQFTEELKSIEESNRSYATKITSLKIESGLYNNSTLVDGLILVPVANVETNKKTFESDVNEALPKISNKSDQDRVVVLQNELNGLLDYIIKQTKQEFDNILQKDVKADAKTLLINSTIEIANGQMTEIYSIKKQQLDELVLKNNSVKDSSDNNVKITSVKEQTSSKKKEGKKK